MPSFGGRKLLHSPKLLSCNLGETPYFGGKQIFLSLTLSPFLGFYSKGATVASFLKRPKAISLLLDKGSCIHKKNTHEGYLLFDSRVRTVEKSVLRHNAQNNYLINSRFRTKTLGHTKRLSIFLYVRSRHSLQRFSSLSWSLSPALVS